MGPYGKGTDTNVIKYDERIHGSIEEEDWLFLEEFWKTSWKKWNWAELEEGGRVNIPRKGNFRTKVENDGKGEHV